MDPEEADRSEDGVEPFEWAVRKAFAPSGNYADIVAFGTNQLHVREQNARSATALVHPEVLGDLAPRWCRLHLANERREVCHTPRLQCRSDPGERQSQPFGRDRLEQIVGGAKFERLDCVPGMGGDKHDRRAMVGCQPLDQLQSGETGHGNVGEEQVDRLLREHGERFQAVRCGSNKFDIVMPGDQTFEHAARERLVIDDKGAKPPGHIGAGRTSSTR